MLHGSERGRKVVGSTVREPGMDPDGGIEIRIAYCHDRGHRSASRQSYHVHPPSVEVVGADDLLRDTGNDGRFATIPMLVGLFEPIPTLGLVGMDCLCGINDKERFTLCEYIHTGAGGEIVWGLCTAMEHDDQR
jgi:hypothetical protein